MQNTTPAEELFDDAEVTQMLLETPIEEMLATGYDAVSEGLFETPTATQVAHHRAKLDAMADSIPSLAILRDATRATQAA